MKSYPHIRRALSGRLWYVHPEKMNEIAAFLECKLAGGSTAPEALESIRATNRAAAARAKKATAGRGAIACIPVYGLLTHRGLADISGGSIGVSTNSISGALRQAIADPNVGSIVMDFDSPGGDVEGIDELASEIYQARKQKRITAVSDCLCASAAYYLASQCSEIIASPSSLTGSVGVYILHIDESAALDNAGVKITMVKYGENKGEGNSFEALADPARDHLQGLVDDYGRAFERAVARGRGITQSAVHSTFGQGRVFTAVQAVKVGMVDRVGTLDDAFATSALSTSSGRRAQFAASHPATPAAKKARALRFARMRHELLVAANGAVAAPGGDTKRALDGEDDCGCDCVPCDGGDCDACDCDSCECEGCGCDSAVAKLRAKKARALDFARMRHELAAARG
jgi:capsid assembly protease